MPSLESLKKVKEWYAVIQERIAGILQPQANPYKELINPERMIAATYEIPEGISEQEAMILTLGAIYDEAILAQMRTTSSVGGSSRTGFNAVFVIEDIFAYIENPGRQGNVPEKMGEGRENAAKAFKEYQNGDKNALNKMGADLIQNVCTMLRSKEIKEASDSVIAYGFVAKMTLDLMNNPSLGFGNLVPEEEKKHIRVFANAFDMKIQADDAEINLKENFSTLSPAEREQHVKQAWLYNALLAKYNKELNEVTSAAANFVYEYTLERAKENGLDDGIVSDPNVHQLKGQLYKKLEGNVLPPSQMLWNGDEAAQHAIDAYWEKLKETEMYQNLMTADEETFHALLETAPMEELPELPELQDMIKERKQENKRLSEQFKNEFKEQFEAVFPEVKQLMEKKAQKIKLVKQLEKEQASGRLIGSMKTMHEYVTLMTKIEAEDVTPEEYKNYLEAMEKVVEKTEALYEKVDGEYVPLTKEDLTELKNCYKDAYKQAIEMGKKQKYMDTICKMLEENIVVLGTLDKKQLTTLPEAMEGMGKVSLDVSGTTLETVEGKMNSRIVVNYTDIDGKTVSGFFTERTEKGGRNTELLNVAQKMASQYPKLEPIKEYLITVAMKDKTFVNIFHWDLNKPVDMQDMSLEEAREDFLDTLLENIENAQPNAPTYEKLLQDTKKLIQENKQEAISFFIGVVNKMTHVLRQTELYSGQLKLPESEAIRIDNRNTAVSKIADLLKVPNLVAQARSMTFMNDGKKIEGTFMEKAEGVDISNLPEDHPMRTYGEDVYNNGNGIKSLADMQVLDYICLNVDRHPGNMVYQFDTTDPANPKFTGVQGIDNDATFGLLTEDKEFNEKGKLTKLENLTVMSQSVFNAIVHMDMEVFQLALKNQKLSNAEIDAACTRVQQLKDKVLEDAEYFKGKEPGVLEAGRIRVIPNDQFAKLTIDDILQVSPEAKTFKYVKEYVMNGVPFADAAKADKQKTKDVQRLVHGDVKPKEEVPIVEINLENKEYYQKMQRDLSKMLLETMRVDTSSIRGSSKEFKAVQASLKESVEFLGKVETPNLEAAEQLQKHLEKVSEAVKKYDKRKEKKSSGSDYEKERKNVIAKIGLSVRGKVSTITNKNELEWNRKTEEVSKKEFNKFQIKEFASNLGKWDAQQPKEDAKRVLASAILMESLTERAMTYLDGGKRNAMFQMTKEQFDKQVSQLVESTKFDEYYKKLDQEQLKADLAASKSVNRYFEDFKKYNVAQEAAPESKQEAVKENNVEIALNKKI